MDARKHLLCIVAGFLGIAFTSISHGANAFDNLGRPATKAEIAGWNIDIAPDGKNLPPGEGTVLQGAQLYKNTCASCHGAKLQGGLGPRLAGGQGTLATAKPIKTVGSYWPYSTTLFDYIRRAMPFQAPQTLTDDQVYSLTAYILHENGIIPETATMNAKTLPAVKMPNRNGFYVDDRPDTKAVRCMAHCLSKGQPPKNP